MFLQGWAELHLLLWSGDSLLKGGATVLNYGRIREEGEQLLRLTQVSTGGGLCCCDSAAVTLLLCSQVNRTLYGAEDSSESWTRYLDYIDDKVQEALFQLLLRSLHFLSDNMVQPQVHTPGAGCSIRLH